MNKNDKRFPVRGMAMMLMALCVTGVQAMEPIADNRPKLKQAPRKTVSDSLNDIVRLQEVTVTADGVRRVKRSAFSTQAVDTRALQNSTRSLGDALGKIAGLKLRETGGVGSDMQLSLDGMSGKHVKVFIDGVPQEGVAQSFGLQNIPAGFAERIEIYKGVVPVQFGTDAMGGVVNIVTRKQRKPWHVEASYSYGSFNTHRWNVHFGHRLKGGWNYEIRAFQNYSDNNYKVDVHVEDFTTGSIDMKTTRRVRRFNDTYHNEAIVGKIGVTDRMWADRLYFTLTYSQMKQQIQNGVRQDIVYGDKHRRAHSWMPQVEYVKHHVVRGLDVQAILNYSYNQTTHIDTAQYKYNWLGERKLLASPGEQSLQHLQADNRVWNVQASATYRPSSHHNLVLSHLTTFFVRSNESLLAVQSQSDAIDRRTRKHHTGLQYRFLPNEHFNLTLFGKHYQQHVSGPLAVNANADSYERAKREVEAWGYGMAATYFVNRHWQAKFSYEKAYRLPTIEEMFGDGDLEMGDMGIRPENSHNLNLSVHYVQRWGKHQLTSEVGGVYRNTSDYIQRNIADLSGGKQAATYINYGKVLTRGYHLSLRYNLGKWLTLGSNFTHMEVLDNMKNALGSTAANLVYRHQMPNLPYLFADSDMSLTWNDCLKRGNTLTLAYDNQYLHSFSYYSSAIGNNKNDYVVPHQFSHNLTLNYSIGRKFHFTAECRNLTDEALYDNFSLQKPGRAFYGKVRVVL